MEASFGTTCAYIHYGQTVFRRISWEYLKTWRSIQVRASHNFTEVIAIRSFPSSREFTSKLRKTHHLSQLIIPCGLEAYLSLLSLFCSFGKTCVWVRHTAHPNPEPRTTQKLKRGRGDHAPRERDDIRIMLENGTRRTGSGNRNGTDGTRTGRFE